MDNGDVNKQRIEEIKEHMRKIMEKASEDARRWIEEREREQQQSQQKEKDE